MAENNWDAAVKLLTRALCQPSSGDVYQAEFLMAKAHKSGLGGLSQDEETATNLLANVVAGAIEVGDLELCKKAEKMMIC